MSHTPGPWELRDSKIVHYSADGTFIVCVVSNQTERHRADALLIAAAPRLLEALKKTKAKFDRMTGDKDAGISIADYKVVARAIALALEGY